MDSSAHSVPRYACSGLYPLEKLPLHMFMVINLQFMQMKTMQYMLKLMQTVSDHGSSLLQTVYEQRSWMTAR